MSELLESYKAQMPERCLSCPVFLAQVVAAEQGEKIAQRTRATVAQSLDLPRRNIIHEQLESIGATIIDISTASEMRLTKTLGILARYGRNCPTPRRGGLPGESVPSRIISWLNNTQVCQNPGLKHIS